MQPKRDPNDRRFWPARLGGTAGFSEYHKKGQPSPYRYGSLSPKGSLGQHPDPQRVYAGTVTDQAKAIDPEAVRARARIVSLRLLDQIDDLASSMDTAETVNALNATGKLTGVAQVQVDHAHTHSLLSGDERSKRAAELMERARKRLLIEGMQAAEYAEVQPASDSPALPASPTPSPTARK